MPSSRLRGSSPFAKSIRGLLLVLLSSPLSLSAFGQGGEPVALLPIRVVILNLSSYPDVSEIRAALQAIDGVERVSLLSEAPGVLTWGVQATVPAERVTDGLRGKFGTRYAIHQKSLPSGVTEIDVVGRPFSGGL